MKITVDCIVPPCSLVERLVSVSEEIALLICYHAN